MRETDSQCEQGMRGVVVGGDQTHPCGPLSPWTMLILLQGRHAGYESDAMDHVGPSLCYPSSFVKLPKI